MIKKRMLLDNAIIERLNDDQLVGMMHELPDTDELLRKAGVDQEVYREILQDAHVMGEVRQLYSALLGMKYEIQAGDETASANQAYELCASIFKKRPHKTMRWADLLWSIGKAPLTGRRVHAICWKEENQQLIPEQIKDIPSHKYAFNYDGELLLKSMEIPEGEIAPDMRFLVTRHMPEATNPYGMAILSACFWPWMFKNGGLKFFVRFCERFGQPFPVGKYPQGTTEPQIAELIDSLMKLVEDSVAALPDDQSIELLESKTSGQLPQERLIMLMNREMSKALTSQTAASELTGDGGSRAASQVHKQRTSQNEKADRALVEDTINQLFEFVTIVNFGNETASPVFKYVDKHQLNKDDVEYIEKAASIVPIRTEDVYKRLGFTEPNKSDDTVFLQKQVVPKDVSEPAEFSKATENWDESDQAISDLVETVKQAIDKGESLEAALEQLAALVPELDLDVFAPIVKNELELEFAQGMFDTQAEEV